MKVVVEERLEAELRAVRDEVIERLCSKAPYFKQMDDMLIRSVIHHEVRDAFDLFNYEPKNDEEE